MLTVSSGSITWRRKLANVAEFLARIDHRVLVTVRDPVEGMFSYYVELYHRFRSRGKSFEQVALYDEAMEIFHYDKLRKELDNLFPRRWYWQSLEGLKVGQVEGIEKWLQRPVDPNGLKGGGRNQTKSSGKWVISGQKASLRDIWGLPTTLFDDPGKAKSRIHPRRIANAAYSRLVGKRIFRQKVERSSEKSLDDLRAHLPSLDVLYNS